MPDKVIDIPGVGPIAFPDTMDDAAVNAAAAKLYREHKPSSSTASQLVRGATATLPVIGGVGGGMLPAALAPATGGASLLGTMAGVGGGTAFGEGLRRILNHLLVNDPNENPGSNMLATGVTAGASAGALQLAPGVYQGLRPTAIINDIERTGSLNPSTLGAEAIKRGVSAVRGAPPPLLKRPLWQAQQGNVPLSDAEASAFGLGTDTPTTASSPAFKSGSSAPDLWDDALSQARQARKPSGPPPVLRKGTGAPSVSESLRTALEEAGAPNPVKGTTPPAPTITSAGKEAGTKGNVFSSGRPSTSAEQYDEITNPLGAKGRTVGEIPKAKPKPVSKVIQLLDDYKQGSATEPAAKSATTKAAKLADSSAGADSLDKVQQAIAGTEDVPTVGNGTPDEATKLAEDIAGLRRKYGAARVGKVVSPNAPEAGVGNVVRAEPGPLESHAPSAMPNIAQDALLRDLKAGKTSDPSKTLRALGQLLKEYKRNAGPAKSPVAQELADLLKKHGFDTGGMP